MKKHSTKEVISEVSKVIKGDYAEYRIGMGNNIDSERHINVAVFSPNNEQAVTTAYKHFTGLGVIAKDPIGEEMKYLYIFKIKGDMFPIDFL